MADDKLSGLELNTLLAEIKMSEALNEHELLPAMQESIRRYTGSYVPSIAVDWSIILNEIYPVMQYNLPAIFLRNPRAYLKPRSKFFIAKRRNPANGEMVEIQLPAEKSAKTQEHILNYELGEIRYKYEVRRTLFDGLLFPHGVLWHGFKGDFGYTEDRSIFIRDERIFVKRTSPMRFLHDPSVGMEDIEEARWTGRSFEIRLDDLLEDDTLDVDKRQIKGELGYGEKIGNRKAAELLRQNGGDFVKAYGSLKNLLSFAGESFKDLPTSRFVTCYELFIRPSQKEKRSGSKGKIAVLTFEQNKPLKVSKWGIKAEGWPGKILMFNPVPEQPFGMSDVDTYKEIADHKNLVTNLQIRNAEQLNKIWVGISKTDAEEEDIEKAASGKNTIIRFDAEDVKSRMFVASAGSQGSSELYLLDQRIDRNLQDKSGVTDLKRGFLQSGEESAESVKQRAAGANTRPAYRQDMMADFLRDSIHYLNQLLRQFTPVKQAVRITGTLDVEWSDNPSREEIQAETDVEVDVTSMLPENPERELSEIGQVIKMAIDIMQIPVVMEKITQEGKVFNLSPLIEQMLMRLKIRNPDVFRSIKPEESMGYVSVAEIKAAQANVEASLRGQNPPSPPAQGQDHRARLEVYSIASQLLEMSGQISDILEALIIAQEQIMQLQQEKENPQAGAVLKNTAPSVASV